MRFSPGRPLVACLLLCLAACGSGERPSERDAEPFDYPVTKRLEALEPETGAVSHDPYDWLHISVAADPQVRRWAEGQSEFTQKALRERSGENTYEDVLALARRWTIHQPTVRDTQIVHLSSAENGSLAFEVSPLTGGLGGEGQLPLPLETGTVKRWAVNQSGTLAAYLTSSEAGTFVRFADLTEGRLLRDAVPASAGTVLLWDGAGEALFYSMAASPTLVEIKKHILGTPSALDEVAASAVAVPGGDHQLALAGDGGLLVASFVDPSRGTTSIFGHAIGRQGFNPLFQPIQGRAAFLGEAGRDLFLLIEDENGSRIVSTDPSKPLPRDWTKILSFARSEGVRRAWLAGGALLVANDAAPATSLDVYSLTGSLLGGLPVPDGPTLTYVGASAAEPFVTLQFTDLIGARTSQIANLQTLSVRTISTGQGSTDIERSGSDFPVLTAGASAEGSQLLLMLTDAPEKALGTHLPHLLRHHLDRGGRAAMMVVPKPSPFARSVAELSAQEEVLPKVKAAIGELQGDADGPVVMIAAGWTSSLGVALSVDDEPPFGALVAENPLTDYERPLLPGPVPPTELAVRMERSPYRRVGAPARTPALLVLADPQRFASSTGHGFKIVAKRQYELPAAASFVTLEAEYRTGLATPRSANAAASLYTFLTEFEVSGAATSPL
ncbi:hypothetical protein [Parvularcula maris]|uniref:Peptidase S9A N-terminal domain-containing protein n=1 Tax=Parvularcula maris TaxID=2965077 RepID=A0A9X2RL57_9PROT|nr:hypothetical protein [Parvularcula maris]MCQ8186483.1 hypothetical protein [Parvularcula maris]